jgi:hypothetical protein
MISKRKRLQQELQERELKELREHTYVNMSDEQESIMTEPCKPPHIPDIENQPTTINKHQFPHLHALFYPNFRKQQTEQD